MVNGPNSGCANPALLHMIERNTGLDHLKGQTSFHSHPALLEMGRKKLDRNHLSDRRQFRVLTIPDSMGDRQHCVGPTHPPSHTSMRLAVSYLSLLMDLI